MTAIGRPAYSSPDPVEFGFIDKANGRLHLEIPLGEALPQRGGKLNPQFRMVYDSNIWGPANGAGTYYWWASDGWRRSPARETTIGYALCGVTTCAYSISDVNDTVHYFPTDGSNSTDSFATDSSGYHIYVHSNIQAYAPEGGLEYDSNWAYGGHQDADGRIFRNIDANGNHLSIASGFLGSYGNSGGYSGSAIYDTLGRIAIGDSDSGVDPNTHTEYTEYLVPNSQGGTSRYLIETRWNIQVKTAFQQPQMAECTGETCVINVVKSIALPDGTSFNFKYDCDSTIAGQADVCESPGGQAAYYGGLTRMTLPTGGDVQYTYRPFKDVYGHAGLWLLTRYAAGGNWQYYPSVLSSCSSRQVGCQQQVSAYSPSGRSDVYTYTINKGAWPTKIQTYAGPSNLVSTTNITWDMTQRCAIYNCYGNDYIRKTSESTTVPGPGSTSLTKKTTYEYDSPQKGNVTAVKEWAFYQGTSPTFPSVPDRAKYISYYAPADSPFQGSGGTNIINKPQSVTICNNSGSSTECPGGGSKAAQTLTTYDVYSGGLSGPLGTANHYDTSYGSGLTVRGNPTKIQRWVSGSKYVTSTFSYDTLGNITQSTDPLLNSTSYGYTDNFVVDSGSGQTQFTPTKPTNAYVTSITHPAVTGGTFVDKYGYYYGSGKKAFSLDWNNQTTSQYFDTLGRPTLTQAPVGWHLTSYTSPTQIDLYDPVVDTTPSTGCVSCRHTEIVLDGWGRKTSEILANSPGGSTGVDTGYDSSGRVSTLSHPWGPQDPTGKDETYGYDQVDRTVSVTHPDTQVYQTAYGTQAASSQPSTLYGYGYPVLTTDEAGNQKRKWVDGFGRLMEVDEPGGIVSSRSTGTFEVSGSLQCNMFPDDCDAGSVSLTVGAYTATVDYSYPGMGYPPPTASSIASQLAASLNQSGIVTATSSSGTVYVTSVGTGSGVNYSCSTSSDSNNGYYPPSFSADAISGCMSGGDTGMSWLPTYYQYDSLNNLTSVAQGMQSRSYVYDGLGRLTSSSNPEKSINTTPWPTQCPETFAYDDNGNLLTKTSPAPNQKTSCTTITTTFTYDALNRVKTKSNSAGTVTYTYDAGGTGANALGRLTSISDPSGSESYTYDAAGRTTQVSKVIGTQTFTTGFQFHPGGQLKQITYPSGRVVTQTPDTIGRLSSISNGSTTYLSIPNGGYNAAGQVLNRTYGNGAMGQFSYSDNRGQLESLNYTVNGQNLINLNYYYSRDPSYCPTGTTGNNGLIQCIQDVTGTQEAGRSASYTYDLVGRLATAQTTGSTAYPRWGLAWSYDRYGNRLSQSITAGSGFSNNLTFSDSKGSRTNRPDEYGFDAAGNQLGLGAIISNVYDAENRLTSANNGAGTYTYDANGLRAKKVAGGSTVYAFANGNLLAEYDNGAAPTAPSREYIYSGSERIAKIEGGASIYYHPDHLSVRALSDATGKVGDRGSFPFGETWYENGVVTKFKLTDKERDTETGNDYFGARYYASNIGRFMLPDPITVTPARIADPQLLNLYAYVRNNPLVFIDPTGMIIDETQLSEEDLENWHRVEQLATERDAQGNLLHPELYAQIIALQQDPRTFVLVSSSGIGNEAGHFEITDYTADNKDFTRAIIALDFKRAANDRGTMEADFGLDFRKFGGLRDSISKIAELLGHEFGHGTYSIANPLDAIQTQQMGDAIRELFQVLGRRTMNTPGVQELLHKYQEGLDRTEKAAQQTEKAINGELRATQKR